MSKGLKRLIAPALVGVTCALGCVPEEEVGSLVRPGKIASEQPGGTPSPSPNPTPTVTAVSDPTPSPTRYVVPSVAVNPTPPADSVPTDAPATDSIPN